MSLKTIRSIKSASCARTQFPQPHQRDATRPPLPAKTFRFPESPNQPYTSRRPVLIKRGVGHRHERWDGMRWTRQRRARAGSQGGFPLRNARERFPGAQTNGAVSAFAYVSADVHMPLKAAWRMRGSRTAKPCGPGTRCWCQAGRRWCEPNRVLASPSIRRRGGQDEFVARESAV